MPSGTRSQSWARVIGQLYLLRLDQEMLQVVRKRWYKIEHMPAAAASVAAPQRRNNLAVVHSKLSTFDTARLDRAFDKLDKDKSGEVNALELLKLLKKMVSNDCTEKDAEELLRAMDKDADGSCSKEELFEFARNSESSALA